MKEEGVRGMYKGLTPTLLALLPNWAIYFTAYEHFKQTLKVKFRAFPLLLTPCQWRTQLCCSSRTSWICSGVLRRFTWFCCVVYKWAFWRLACYQDWSHSRANLSTDNGLRLVVSSEVFFKIKSILFLDTLILQIYFLIIKINNFRGDVSDISAETATLVVRVLIEHPCVWESVCATQCLYTHLKTATWGPATTCNYEAGTCWTVYHRTSASVFEIISNAFWTFWSSKDFCR